MKRPFLYHSFYFSNFKINQKYTHLILIIFLLLSSLITNNAILPQSNDGFWEEFDKIDINHNLKTGFANKFSKDDIIALALKYKREKKYHPVKFIHNLKSRYYKWGAEFIKDNNTYLTKPAVLLRILREKMSEYLGNNYVDAISIDYLLKVFVESVDYSNYYSNGKIMDSQINVHCKIVDILKGKDHFRIDDKITISYLQWWTEGSLKKFEVGGTYLIPTRPWKIKNENAIEYTLHLFEKDRYNVYPIDNDKINFSTDFLGLQNHTSWTTFKNNFFSLLNLYGK